MLKPAICNIQGNLLSNVFIKVARQLSFNHVYLKSGFRSPSTVRQEPYRQELTFGRRLSEFIPKTPWTGIAKHCTRIQEGHYLHPPDLVITGGKPYIDVTSYLPSLGKIIMHFYTLTVLSVRRRFPMQPNLLDLFYKKICKLPKTFWICQLFHGHGCREKGRVPCKPNIHCWQQFSQKFQAHSCKKFCFQHLIKCLLAERFRLLARPQLTGAAGDGRMYVLL